MVVQLRRAPLPLIGAIAVHYWFVVIDDAGVAQRWEVWQTANAGGRSFGHVHCNLKAPDAGVGGGPSRIVREWSGEEAGALHAVLQDPGRYPYCDRYLVWPGPNSNTFAAWVLRQAGIDFRLGWRGIGKGFR